MEGLKWYRRLSDVPGVTWSAPPGITPDQRLAGAKPTHFASEFSFEPQVLWIDESGNDIPGDPHRSPALNLLPDLRSSQSGETLAVNTSLAFAVPGRTEDYLTVIAEALSRLDIVGPISQPGQMIHNLTGLAIDIDAAFQNGSEKAYEDQGGEIVAQCFNRLVNLYIAEGFLHEAELWAKRSAERPMGSSRGIYVEVDAELIEGLRDFIDEATRGIVWPDE